ncbi:hypothetical protein [Nonomuraea rubra]|uniref:hypothetical protein n=1 Tax=Nonomuraea rubra TaxID=46180 RepID=UPI0031EEEC1D
MRGRERLRSEYIELSGTPVTRTHRLQPLGRHAPAVAGRVPSGAADGVLVALPDPYTLLVHPVDGIGVVRAIERLRVHAARTMGSARRFTGAHGGRLTLIRADIVTRDGQTRLVVAPPPDFARVLARLAV